MIPMSISYSLFLVPFFRCLVNVWVVISLMDVDRCLMTVVALTGDYTNMTDRHISRRK
jgi:hypothetical protein